MSETNEEKVDVAPEVDEEVETISIPKTEFEKLNQTLGSLKREVKDLKKPKDEPKEEPQQSNEPDYGRLAYLHARQITAEEDIKAVNDEALRLKLPLNAVLEMEHVKARLKTNQEKREAAEGLPSSTNKSGGKGKNDVEYWVVKGGLPDDQELAEKVVAAREKQLAGKKFSDEMFSS